MNNRKLIGLKDKEFWPVNPSTDLNKKVAYVFAKTKVKFLHNLTNISNQTLPIDALFYTKKYILFHIILEEFENIFMNKVLLIEQISNQNNLLQYLLQRSTKNFFNECVSSKNKTIDVDITLLVNFDIGSINALKDSLEILMLFFIYGSSYKTKMIFSPIFGKQIPIIQIEILLENLIIEISNFIIDALLRSSQGIKFAFQYYIFNDRHYSIRKIEQIRNNLMWYKFVNKYINIPKNIYENKYSVWIISPRGIISKNISGHRLYELSNLSTTQLIITFLLEIQDFFLPKISNFIQFLFKTICYIIYNPLKSKISTTWQHFTHDLS